MLDFEKDPKRSESSRFFGKNVSIFSCFSCFLTNLVHRITDCKRFFSKSSGQKKSGPLLQHSVSGTPDNKTAKKTDSVVHAIVPCANAPAAIPAGADPSDSKLVKEDPFVDSPPQSTTSDPDPSTGTETVSPGESKSDGLASGSDSAIFPAGIADAPVIDDSQKFKKGLNQWISDANDEEKKSRETASYAMINCFIDKDSKLSLSDDGLTSLPSVIGSLHKLEVLDISHNNLTSLPSAIGSLHKLKSLDISHNNLTSLPSAIGSLHKLQFLNIPHNNLTSLPSAIGSLHKLQFLNIPHNNLTSPPPFIKSLTFLDISGNAKLNPSSLHVNYRSRQMN